MLDKNIVILEGVVGDDFKWAKTQEGKEFATFSLCIDSYIKEFADSTERSHSQTFVRINVFDKRYIEYLHRIKLHAGHRVSVFGRLNSSRNEYKGISLMQNNVVCRSIEVIRTMPDKENNKKNKNNKNEQQENE